MRASNRMYRPVPRRSDDEFKCRQRQAADGERADPRDPAPTLASELPPHSIPAGRARLCDRSEILAQVEAGVCLGEVEFVSGKVAGSPVRAPAGQDIFYRIRFPRLRETCPVW